MELINMYDNRQVTKEVSTAWYDLIYPYTLDEAKYAVKKHYNESDEWLMPAHIIRIIKAERRARLAKVGAIATSRADMTDTATELDTARQLTRAIASGQLTPEQYGDYLRSDTPWSTYRRGILALRGAA